jgi:hypothetical protein
MSRPIVRFLSPEIQGDGSYFVFYGVNCICTLITLSVLRFYPCTFLFSNVTPYVIWKVRILLFNANLLMFTKASFFFILLLYFLLLFSHFSLSRLIICYNMLQKPTKKIKIKTKFKE